MIIDDRTRAAAQPALPAKAPNGKPTLAFLTANIHMGVGRSLWPGVVDAAERHGVNLICFPGGGLRAAESFEDQRNAIYSLINPELLDGLVSWASTVGEALEPAEVREFHRRYEPLPMVSLVQIIDGVPTLAIDSYQGMRALIAHLVEVHGYRRLAFIRGPGGHFYAQERYRAYTDSLQEYGIPFAPELVTPPLHWDAGSEAVGLLLDQAGLRPGADIEAIVAVSDLLALGALKALQARGVRVPRDLAVVGFNNSSEGRLTTPPLTSVAMPFYEQGTRAVDVVLALMDGQEVAPQAALPSRLVVRRSCGCPSQDVAQAEIAPDPAAGAGGGASLPQATLAALGQLWQGAPEIAAWAGPVLDAFCAALVGAASGDFLATLERALESVAAAGHDVTVWNQFVSTLRQRSAPALDRRAWDRAENLYQQARVVIGEVAQRAQAYRQLQAERQAEVLRDIGQALITTFDIDTLADVLAERLPQIGIRSGYLALYEQPGRSLDQARLVLAYTEQGRAALPPEGRRFAARQLVPRDLLPRHRPYALVVEPLTFREEQIGFAVFEIGPRDGTMYEVLRGQISSALKGALLIRESQQARLAAEKADQIKTRLLANVSHELRTPLHIILGYTKNALSERRPYGAALPQLLLDDLQHIQHSAEHQLRLINDLLDLSRAEIDELDLYLELLDPRPLLVEAFESLAHGAASAPEVRWELVLPERLPCIQADPLRLRQIMLNLLSNARKFTERGAIALGAEVAPPYLHVWVRDTGIGIPEDQQERIFDPFVVAEHNHHLQRGGIGLGLSITRRLVALHGGAMELDSRSGAGSTFRIMLPLPSLGEHTALHPAPAAPALLLIAGAAQPAAEIVEFSRRQGIPIHRLAPDDDLDAALADIQPTALAWDLTDASPGDWALVRRLRNHPRVCPVPFILYGQVRQAVADEQAVHVGLTSFVDKPASSQTLLDAINASCPAGATGPILIVDDDPGARAAYQELVGQGLPGYQIRSACDGRAAQRVMEEDIPSLVILDLIMPGMEGTDVLDWMRATPHLRQVPVIILSNKPLNFEDIRRIEQHAHVTLQSKGILSDSETITALNRALFGTDSLPQHTSALVKRAVAYLHQNYARPLSRWELASTIGVSEDYLSRVFSRELGLSPWEYLNRYRIYHAKALLRRGNASVSAVAQQVGFQDRAYFSRVFHKLTGVPPQEFRKRPE